MRSGMTVGVGATTPIRCGRVLIPAHALFAPPSTGRDTMNPPSLHGRVPRNPPAPTEGPGAPADPAPTEGPGAPATLARHRLALWLALATALAMLPLVYALPRA